MHDAPLFASLDPHTPSSPADARSNRPRTAGTRERPTAPDTPPPPAPAKEPTRAHRPAKPPALPSAQATDAPRAPDGALLIGERDAARILAISERKLWELRMQGLIPHLRIGRAVRYDPNDLKTWINEQKRATAR